MEGEGRHQRDQGRPSERTPEIREQILRAIGVGVDYKTAASCVGKSHNFVRTWRREDADFRAECEMAQGGAVVTVASALIAACNKGNVSAMQFFLETRTDEFRKLRPAHTDDYDPDPRFL
jgi:hypothetical protein